MKLPRVPRKPAVTAGIGVATLVLLFVNTGITATGSAAIASTNQLGCSRPLAPPRGQPASLRGWYSSKNRHVTHQIGLDQRGLAREGVQLTQWGPDPCSGKVKVYLTHYSRAAARVLVSTYGNDIIVSRQSMPRPPVDSRSSDISPFNGGDFIALGGFLCTGGPVVVGRTDNTNYMLTAGHCDPHVGDLVGRSDRHGSTFVSLGFINVFRLCNLCIDVAQIKHGSLSARYNLQVWLAGDNSTFFSAENGSCFPQPFNLVTQDSAFTGEITGITVEDVNQSVTFNDGLTRVELTLAHAGQTIVNSGDSGGPWIQRLGSTGNVCVAGTTVGGAGEFAYYQQIGGIDTFLNTFVPHF